MFGGELEQLDGEGGLLGVWLAVGVGDFVKVLLHFVIELQGERAFQDFFEERLEVLLDIQHYNLLLDLFERGDDIDQEYCDIWQAFI